MSSTNPLTSDIPRDRFQPIFESSPSFTVTKTKVAIFSTLFFANLAAAYFAPLPAAVFIFSTSVVILLHWICGCQNTQAHRSAQHTSELFREAVSQAPQGSLRVSAQPMSLTEVVASATGQQRHSPLDSAVLVQDLDEHINVGRSPLQTASSSIRAQPPIWQPRSQATYSSSMTQTEPLPPPTHVGVGERASRRSGIMRSPSLPSFSMPWQGTFNVGAGARQRGNQDINTAPVNEEPHILVGSRRSTDMNSIE